MADDILTLACDKKKDLRRASLYPGGILHYRYCKQNNCNNRFDYYYDLQRRLTSVCAAVGDRPGGLDDEKKYRKWNHLQGYTRQHNPKVYLLE